MRARVKIGNTDSVEFSSAESGAAVEPVVVSQFIDLDPFPVGRRVRHLLCRHRQRLFQTGLGRQSIVMMKKTRR